MPKAKRVRRSARLAAQAQVHAPQQLRQPVANPERDGLAEAFSQELIDMIVLQIEDSATLNALSKVSRGWEQVTAKRLYEVVIIDNDNLFYFLHGTHHGGNFQWMRRNNTQFAYTKTLELRAHPKPANFTIQELNAAKTAISSVLIDIVSRARRLERFSCHFWKLPSDPAYGTRLNLPSPTLTHFAGNNEGLAFRLAGLTRLNLVGIDVVVENWNTHAIKVTFIAHIISQCPGLEHLHISLVQKHPPPWIPANGPRDPSQIQVQFFRTLCMAYTIVGQGPQLQLKTLICGYGVLPVGPKGLDMLLRKGDRCQIPFDTPSDWYLDSFLNRHVLETLEINNNSDLDMTSGDRYLATVAQTQPGVLRGRYTGAIAWTAIDPRWFPNLKRFGFTGPREDWTPMGRARIQRAYTRATGSPLDLSRCPHTIHTLSAAELKRRKPFARLTCQPYQRVLLGPKRGVVALLHWYEAADDQKRHKIRCLLSLKGVEELWIQNDAEQSPDKRVDFDDCCAWENADINLDGAISTRLASEKGDPDNMDARRRQLANNVHDRWQNVDVAVAETNPWKRKPASPCWTYRKKWQAITEAITDASKNLESVAVKRLRVGSLLFRLERVFEQGTGKLLEVRPVPMGVREQLAYGLESLDDATHLLYQKMKAATANPYGFDDSRMRQLGW